MQPPARSAHTLASHGIAKAILVTWAVGVPLLAVGLTVDLQLAIALGSAVLLAGVALNATQAIGIVNAEPTLPKMVNGAGVSADDSQEAMR